MKRSRACDDLVALAQEATACSSSSSSSFSHSKSDGWHAAPAHRFKRSRAAVDSPASSSDEGDEQELQERHSLQFTLEMSDLECLGAEVMLSASAPATASVLDDDSLPLHRNSKMLLRKKQRVAEITSSFRDCCIRDEDMERPVVKQQPVDLMETPETPEPRILRGLCFPREARCIDPLDKRQAQPFDVSTFIMLSISPQR